MILHKEYRFFGVLYLAAALVCGILVLGASLVSGMTSFMILALTLQNPASLDYYETVTVCTYLVYVLIVSVLICFAASKSTRLKMVGTFLSVALAFWVIHDSLPLGVWIPLVLGLIAALPIYQILVRRARK